MAGMWEAKINRLYFALDGTLSAADSLKIGQPYDVIAEIEVGAALNNVNIEDKLVVTVTNLTTGMVVRTEKPTRVLTPTNTIRRESRSVDFASLVALDGDVLTATCSYRAEGGGNVSTDTGSTIPTPAVA
ncbi:hypothetical protein [Streptomyces sp. NPDC053079]|uniref:hypothetical protein n=1 Tax=Streptomyces sp. NPDC053079 TaxID=3365697 RepID=UPI0037D33270